MLPCNMHGYVSVRIARAKQVQHALCVQLNLLQSALLALKVCN